MIRPKIFLGMKLFLPELSFLWAFKQQGGILTESQESTSYSDLGVFECYRQLSLEIYNAFGIKIPPEEIEPHIVNCAVKIGGRSQSIAEIKNKVYLEAAEKIASRGRNYCTRNTGNSL